MTRGILTDWRGQRQGSLLVLARTGADRNKHALWSCKCDCGNEVEVRAVLLKRGQRFCSKQCPIFSGQVTHDLTGKEFGRLTAVRFVTKSGKSRKAVWEFKCRCGKAVERVADNMLTGFIRSCGCLGIESRITHGQSQTKWYRRFCWQEYQAAKINRMPKWLSDEDRDEIAKIHAKAVDLSEATGIPHEVDHVIPLRGKTVSGLHVPWNLQPITRSANRRKSRKLLDELCYSNGN